MIVVGAYRNDDAGTSSGSAYVFDVPNTPPTIMSAASDTATEGVQYSYTATATDPEGGTLTWSIAGSDTCGGSLSGNTYTFTPASPIAPVTCVVALEVCDDGTPSKCVTQSTTVTVTPVNDAPEFVAPTPASMATLQVIEADTLTFRVAADDPDGDTLTYAVDPLPAGATFGAATGEFAWTPTWEDAGTYAIRLEVSDGDVTIERDITLEVSLIDDDNDGLPDTWEEANGLDPTTRDSDGDTIDDLEEVGDISALFCPAHSPHSNSAHSSATRPNGASRSRIFELLEAPAPFVPNDNFANDGMAHCRGWHPRSAHRRPADWRGGCRARLHPYSRSGGSPSRPMENLHSDDGHEIFALAIRAPSRPETICAQTLRKDLRIAHESVQTAL